MTCRIFLAFGVVVLLGTLCSSRPAYAQSQSCVDTASASHPPIKKTKISIVSVEFQGENPLSDAQREQLVKHIQQQDLWTTPEEPDSSWVNQALDPIRDALREQGYFRADVEGIPYLALVQANERRYVLAIAIETGPQYRLGNLRFASESDKPLLFTAALLTQQIHMQEGEPFDVSKIREGLEAMGRLYGSKGYIDATPEPDTTIDEKDSRIDLLIKVDEEQRYTIAKMAFLGLDAAAQNKLTLPQENGEPFNSALWRNFFKENKPHLPADASPSKNMQVQRDVSSGTVDITLDFRPCPYT